MKRFFVLELWPFVKVFGACFFVAIAWLVLIRLFDVGSVDVSFMLRSALYAAGAALVFTLGVRLVFGPAIEQPEPVVPGTGEL